MPRVLKPPVRWIVEVPGHDPIEVEARSSHTAGRMAVAQLRAEKWSEDAIVRVVGNIRARRN